MKKIALFVLAACSFCLAKESMVPVENLDISFRASYLSKYLWNGIDVYGSKSASKFDIDFDYTLVEDYQVYAGVSYIMPNGSGQKQTDLYDGFNIGTFGLNDLTEADYYVGFRGSLFSQDVYGIDYDLGYKYHDFTKTGSDTFDFQELSGVFKLAQLGIVVPYYNPIYVWDGSSGTNATSGGTDFNADCRGWIHNVGIEVPLEKYVLRYVDLAQMSSLKFIAQATYYDGVVSYDALAKLPLGKGYAMDSDWTHITWGLESDFDVLMGQIGLGVYFHQALVSNLDLIADDTLYAIVSYTYDF